MSALAQDNFEDRIPTEIEIDNADQLRKIMANLITEDRPTEMQLALGKGETANVTLSPAIANTFLQVLQLISKGKGFRLIPVGAELTTLQAADHLNVSRPFLIKLLEAGEVPFTKTGRHRRVKAEDLFAYKAARDAQRSDALSDMAKLDSDKGYL